MLGQSCSQDFSLFAFPVPWKANKLLDWVLACVAEACVMSLSMVVSACTIGYPVMLQSLGVTLVSCCV